MKTIDTSFLGKTAIDSITGFKGIVTSVHGYLNGCTQYGLQPKAKEDDTLPDVKFFDEGRLTITCAEPIASKSVTSDENGCDHRERP